MIKKILSFALASLLLVNFHASVIFAQTKTDETAAAKIKAAVAKRGTGENKRVRVTMRDGTKLKGYISRMDEDSFVLVNSKTNQSATLAYRDVAKVKTGLSGDTIALIAIGGAAAAAAIVLGTFLFKRCRNEGGC